MTAPPASARTEFSRPVSLDRIGRQASEHDVSATETECVAIAARLQVPAVLALSCRFTLVRAGDGVTADGRLRALLVRECVVSLEPFEQPVEEAFRVRFVPTGSEDDDDPLSEDQLPFDGGRIDLGEAVVEQLALALDPYPRRPDAALPRGEAEAAGPFAVLERRRGGRG